MPPKRRNSLNLPYPTAAKQLYLRVTGPNPDPGTFHTISDRPPVRIFGNPPR